MRLIDADGSYTLNASDNTDYSLCFGGEIISVIDKHGHIDCEFFADDAPTIDAEPVRHGHWIYNKDTGEIRCNLCNALVGVTMYPDDVELITEVENFCFNCGAKMDEDGGE